MKWTYDNSYDIWWVSGTGLGIRRCGIGQKNFLLTGRGFSHMFRSLRTAKRVAKLIERG